MGIKTEILNIKGHYDLISAIKLYFLVKKYSPKLVIAHNGRSFSIVNLYNSFIRNKNFKTLAISHGGNPKRLIGFDYIITVAEHLGQSIKEKYQNFPQNKIITIHNGIKINNIHRDKHKGKNKEFTCGILSRLSPEKNIITALKSFKKFTNDVKNSKLIIAGEGSQLASLKEFVIKENLEKQVSFIGHIKNIEKFFDKIDLFLHPAIKEPFGLVILEAFNYYTPVIGANSGGLKEIIKDGFNGYLYNNPTCHKSLYKAMNDYYFNKKDSKDKIINNARKTLEEDFLIKKVENKVTTTISNIIRL